MNPDFRKTLHYRLKETHDFPARYTFKFIVPSEESKIAAIRQLFEQEDAEISLKTSSKKTFTSVTIRLEMESAEAILKKYEAAAGIEGIIAL